jgi:hypothetical protein
LSPISFVVHVLPASKLTPSSMPAAGKSTFETSTMFWGFVGLTAIASSDSFVCRWLMSTLVGVVGVRGWAAAAGTTIRETAANAETIAMADGRRRIFPLFGLTRLRDAARAPACGASGM